MKRYSTTEEMKTSTGIRYLKNTIYPEVPFSEDDIYINTDVGDRYDKLAQTFYNDHTLWWIIASANNSTKDSLIPDPGSQLRIPTNIDNLIENFRYINKIR